jgi:dinuclear metal center YbgI/SA1388 family protein
MTESTSATAVAAGTAADGTSVTVADVVTAMDRLYPSALAADWDAVGLVCGRPDRAVKRILVAVDPVAPVVAEAVAWGADLLITHHPLLLTGVHSVAATDPKGEVITTLIEAQCALLCAHTNADAARPGVSDALADLLGLVDLRPLTSAGEEADPIEALVVFVPEDHVDGVIDAMTAAGAGRVADYTRCAFAAPGRGTFQVPDDGDPWVGHPGERAEVVELRVEMAVRRSARDRVVAAMLAAHPYQQPAYFALPTVAAPSATGTGRVGRLPTARTLAEFASQVAAALPATQHGVRVAGDPARIVSTVAVCGGAGDSLLPAAAGADVFVTADLRHHRADEHLGRGGAALVDVAHWASEWPWCQQVADLLPAQLSSPASVTVRVSEIVTDPWTAHLSTDRPRRVQ